MLQVKPFSLSRLIVSACALSLLVSVVTEAQITRAELVESGSRAYFNLEYDRARDFFVRAVNPVSEPPDSIWAVAVQYLTQMYIEAGNVRLAETWMHWAVRHHPDMQVDSIDFTPAVISTYYAALGNVGDGAPGDSVTETTWEWPPLGNRDTDGTLRIGPSSLQTPIFVSLAEARSITPGQRISLPPGTYSIRATAEGYETAEVMREILPGVTSVLTFDLVPAIVAPEAEASPDMLPEAVESHALDQLARFTVMRYRTEPTCGTGVFVGGDGLLLTTYAAIRGAESLEFQHGHVAICIQTSHPDIFPHTSAVR